jgi:RNA polymerase sigma-B factor
MPAPPPATDVEQLHACFASTRDPAVRAELLAHYDWLALSLARQFRTRRESREDLGQVARIGLIHAVDRYDPARGRPFTAFARATIIGEIKRHLRDHTWSLHVPRTLQEHYYQVVGAVDQLTQAEIGRRVGVNQMGISRTLTRTLDRMRVLAGEENSGASTVRQCRRGPRARAC